MVNRWTGVWRHLAIAAAAGTAFLCGAALAQAQGRVGTGPNIGQTQGGGAVGNNQFRVGYGSPQSTAIGQQGRAAGTGMVNTGMRGTGGRVGDATNQLGNIGDGGFNSAGIAGANGLAMVGQPGFNASFRPQLRGGPQGTGPGSTVTRNGATIGNPLAVNPLTSGLTGATIPSAADPLTGGGLTGGTFASAADPLTSGLTGSTPPSAADPLTPGLAGANPLAVNPVNTGTVFLPAAGGSLNSTRLQPLLGFTLPAGSNVRLANNSGVLVLRGNLQAGNLAEATRQSLLIESLLRLQGVADIRNELRSANDQPLNRAPR